MSNTFGSDQNVKIDISVNPDTMEPGIDQARQNLDGLSQSTSKFEQAQKSAIDSSERMAQVTGRTREQFAQLGKEVISGDTGRVPGTLASIAMGMLPVAGGVVAIAGAVAAGVWAWNEWGNSAADAAKKSSDAFKAADKDRIAAERGIHQTLQEQIRDLEYKRSGVTGQLEAALARRDSLPSNASQKQMFDTGGEVLARRAELAAYDRQIADLREKASEKDRIEQSREDKEENRVSREIEREKSKYEKLHEMAISFNATDADRVTWKLAFDLQKMEEEHAASKKIYGNNVEMEQAYQDSRIERTALAEAEIEKINKAALDKKQKHDQEKMRQELSVVNFSKLLRQGDFTDAMSMAEKMTAGLATKSRAAFEVNKAASLAKATVQGYQMIQAAAADGASWGGYFGAIAEGALATAYVLANLDAINSTQFGGGGRASVPSGGGVPSQATSPGVPVTPTATGTAAQTPQQVNLTLVGVTHPDNPQFTYNQIVNDLIPLINQAAGNGVNIVVTGG